MDKIKTILDREPISSNYIRSKQDFAQVTNGAKGLSKAYWKTNWFYGTVGVTAVAIFAAALTLYTSDSPEENAVDKTAQTKSEEANNPAPEAQKSVVAGVSDSDEAIEIAPEAPAQKEVETVEKPEVQETKPPVEPAPTMARMMPEPEPVVEVVEIVAPNVAGISSGPISFKNFCDPLGIQVGDGVLIHQYTIQYRSCARDVTARVRGNRLPGNLCDEIRDCGSAIEVTFSNFVAEDREGGPVQLKTFSLVTSPK